MLLRMAIKPGKTEEPEAEDAPAAKKSGGKKKLILLAAPVVLLVGGGAGLWFSGILPGLLGLRHDPHSQEAARPVIPVFVDLPDMIANLAGPSNKASYVKLQARLEVSK